MSLTGAIKSLVAVLASLVAISAHAFMPASGLWAVDSELATGKSGRGFTITVENEVLLLTYYGYRANGTGTWFLAAGALTGNNFYAPLTEFSGGQALGTAFKAATPMSPSPGNVSITFTSGKSGTITFPGESPQKISKYEFGYSENAQGLLGTYLFAYTTTLGTTYTDTYNLNTVLNSQTTTGNGIVSDANFKIGCEHQVTGVLAGQILCAEVGSTGNEDYYYFKMSGDRGTGVGTWKSNTTNAYPLQVIRTATKTGKLTGINDGTASSLVVGITNPRSKAAAQSQSAVAQQNFDFDNLKAREPKLVDSGFGLSAEELSAARQWAFEAGLKLNQ